MAKEKAKATARADAAQRRSAADKRHGVVKKVSKYYRERNHRNFGPQVDLPARLQLNKPSFKSYFEFQENKDKKDKKLDTTVTKDVTPPPGFSFVPVGNPELTKKCKDLSRENGYLIFIVSDTLEERQSLHDHVHRVGYHFRSAVVEDACNALGGIEGALGGKLSFKLEDNDKVPETQAEINKQADAALRDLFPRIPNHDREQIILQSFQKGAIGNSRRQAEVVGLAKELPLARRVQLAANAHIRHVHTRYDELLRETNWQNARRLVEPVCLDIIMKWRGDEETGRDQLDEILREVVIIPDSEDEDEGEEKQVESASTSDDDLQFVREVARAPPRQQTPQAAIPQNYMPVVHRPPGASRKPHLDDPDYERKMLRHRNKKPNKNERRSKQQKPDKQERRGFTRWARYDEAKKRSQNPAQYTASAGLTYDDENVRQDPAPQQPYPPHALDRQPLQDCRYGQLNNNSDYQEQFTRQQVGKSIPQPLEGLPEKDRLPDNPQDTFARGPQDPYSQQQMTRSDSTRPEYQPPHQRNPTSHQGLPILTYEQHQKRQQQYHQDQRMPQRPRSPDILASIENIDLTDSPVRRNSPRLESLAPRRVMTAPQPRYVSEYRQVEPKSQPSHPLPESSDMVYVHDHDGKRRRLIHEPMPRVEPEYVLVQRQRQESQTFPVSRAQGPVSQPDTRWIDEAYNPHQPIMISSSPFMESIPAVAPQQRTLVRGGEPHSRQPSGMRYDDIFQDDSENQARAQRGESKRPRPSDGFGQDLFMDDAPGMRRVDPRDAGTAFGVPSALQRASTIQYPLQGIRRPEPGTFAPVQQSQPRPVEQLPVYNRFGERIQVPDAELQRLIREADSRGPVYVRGSVRASLQQEYQETPQYIREQSVYDEPGGSQYVSEARPRHDYRSIRPAPPLRVQSDIEAHQPRYRERSNYVDAGQPLHAYQPLPHPQDYLPIRRAPTNGPIEVIGADGQRYLQIQDANGGPPEVLPIRTQREATMGPESRPQSRPQSRLYREGTQGPMRTQSGFERFEGGGGQPQPQPQPQQRGHWRDDVIVLDD